MTIANTILAQLGGSKFKAMTSAKCFSQENGLLVQFKGCKEANVLNVILTQDDLYTVTFSKVSGMNHKVVSEIKGVYHNQLTAIFEQETGLSVSL